jgi:vancomycin resistance protein YoaR
MKQAPKRTSLVLPGLPTLIGGAVVAALLFVLLAVGVNAAPDQLPMRVKFLGRTVSRQSPDDALKLLDSVQADVERRGIRLHYRDTVITVPVTLTDPSDLALAVTIAGYDREETSDRLAKFGHSGNAVRDAVQRFRAFYLGATVLPVVDLDRDRLSKALDEALRPLEKPAQNARFVYSEGRLRVEPESSGTVFDRSAVFAAIEASLAAADPEPITVELADDVPDISAGALESVRGPAEAALAGGPLTLTFEDAEWKFEPESLAGWLTADPSKSPRLALNAAAVDTALAATSGAVARPVKNPRFSIANGRVTEFQPAENGRAMDAEKVLAAISGALINSESRSIAVATKVIEPTGDTGDTNTLGIKELVAEGRTNFAGSPVNRRFNIKVGADKLNGIIIKPGDTFSLVSALVPIDAKGGYRQELVIKGNRTIPEYGGGLCQIGTTMFRLVLNAGLPILERRNHSYRVRYYEPPVGKDATIYDPKPDFRFTNDYKYPLLLTTEIDGNDLVFRFYGTKDARKIVQTAPRIFNVVPPPPKQVIETTEIPAGTTKCLEKPHPGSDAEFTYAVTYPDGTVKSEVFKSHYRPWQEVCLKGVKTLPSENDGTNTNGSADAESGSDINDSTAAPTNTDSSPLIEDLPN